MMTTKTTKNSQNNGAGIAGFMFLLSLLVPILNWIFVLSKFIVAENAIATSQNILSYEFLFRINITNELIVSAIAIALAVALYIILKSVNKIFALLALFLKLTEAILLAVIALGHYIALLALKGQPSLSEIEPEQLQAFIGLFLNLHIPVTAISGVFMGMNMLVFSCLLFKSKYIPGLLATFGILSYSLVFIYDFLIILLPGYASIMIIQIICSAPICFFQLIVGIWLLFRGIKSEQPAAFESN
jgi:hypothetical protein